MRKNIFLSVILFLAAFSCAWGQTTVIDILKAKVQISLGQPYVNITSIGQDTTLAAASNNQLATTQVLKAFARKFGGRPVSTAAPSIGQVVKWDGTKWAPAADAGGTAISADSLMRAVALYTATSGTLPTFTPNANYGPFWAKNTTDNVFYKWNRTGGTWSIDTDALTGDVTKSNGSTATTIADGAVTSTKIANSAVTDAKITSVDPNKLLQDGATTGQVLTWDGSMWNPATPSGGGWGLAGNAAISGSSFLGTTNNTSLRFRTNNLQRMIADSLGNIGIGIALPTERLHIVGGNIQIDAGRRHKWSDGSYMEGGGTSSLFTIRSLGNYLLHGGNFYLSSNAGTPAAKLHVVGAGSSASTFGMQIHNNAGNNALIINDAGWIGMGTATMGADRLDIQGTSVSDGPAIGAELATTATGTGWTGTSFATGYSHTGGAGTDPLTATGLTISSSALYQVTFTVTARTAGSFVATMGGITSSAITATSNLAQEFTTSTATLAITPTANFDGTIVVSVKRITATTPLFITKGSDGIARIQIRHAHAGATIIGNSAGQFASLTGTRKTFIGTAAGQRSTTGISTTAVGADAGSSNSIGSNWTAVGAETAISNRTGGNWTGIGVQAGNANTTGGNWTAIGYRAGYGNTLYSDWVAVGRNAAPQVHFQNGVYIGGGVNATEGVSGTPTTNETVIGYSASGLGSNTVAIGNASTTQTWLGGSLTVGTTVTPLARLHVQIGTATQVGFMVRAASSQTANIAQFQNNAGTTLSSITANGSIVIPNSADLNWSTFSKITSAANGNLTLYNNTYNDFGILQFGGTGATMPGLKRFSNNTLQVISSDDATASNLLVTGSLAIGATSAAAKVHIVGTGATNATWSLQVHNNENNNALMVRDDGRTAIGTASPAVARLTIAAGTTSIAPLNIPAGTNTTSIEAGAIENDGTNLKYSPDVFVRYDIIKGFTGTSTALDFPNLSLGQYSVLTFSDSRVKAGDRVLIANPNFNGGAMLFTGGCTVDGTVYIQAFYIGPSSLDMPSTNYTYSIIR